MNECGYNKLCGPYHVLGCPGHPFHRDYWPSATPERREDMRLRSTRTLYADGVLDTEEMERRVDAAVDRVVELDGDRSKP